MEYEAIYVNFHAPDEKTARSLAEGIFAEGICSTIKLTKNVRLYYPDGDKVDNAETYLITVKSVKRHLDDIEKYILANHPWGTPCIEVIPLVADHC